MRTESKAVSQTNNKFYTMKAILFALLIGIVVSMVLLIIFSAVITVKDTPQGMVPTLSAIAVAFGGFASGLSCSKFMKKNGLVFGLISGGFLFIVLTLTGLAFGNSNLDYLTAIRFLISLICGALGGILGVNSKKNKKY